MKKIVASLGIGIAVVCYFSLLFLIVGFTTALLVPTLFTLLFVLLCLVSVLVFLEEPVVEQYFYSLPGAYIAMYGLMIQAAVGVILAVLHLPMILQLVIELILFGVAGTLECYVLFAGLRARELKKKYEEKTGAMRDLRAQADVIWKTAPDYEWKRRAKAVAEMVSYANPVREDLAIEFEEAVYAELTELENAMRADDPEAFEAARKRIRNLLSH